MPAPTPSLSVDDVHRHAAERGFLPNDERRVGVEAEWLTIPVEDPTGQVQLEVLDAVVRAEQPLPGRSRVSFEPGGQLELSSLPHTGVGPACLATLAALRLRRPQSSAAARPGEP